MQDMITMGFAHFLFLASEVLFVNCYVIFFGFYYVPFRCYPSYSIFLLPLLIKGFHLVELLKATTSCISLVCGFSRIFNFSVGVFSDC